MTPKHAEVAIIGGGPAGAAAAIRLATAGRDVLVLERDREVRHKVCGEFLSAEALASLAVLGEPALALGAARIDRVRIGAGDIVAENALPFSAAGLARETVDAALLRRAELCGARIAWGAFVRKIERERKGASLHLGTGDMIRAQSVVLATGKSDLGHVRRSTRWEGRENMIGLKMHMRLTKASRERLGSAIELHLFPGGCAGFQPVNEMANLCITLSRTCFARCGNRFDRLLDVIAASNAGFAAALVGAEPLWRRPLAVARVPYGYLGTPAGEDERLWRVGDQIAVTASLTGDGLAIALESGMAAAASLISGEHAGTYERRFRRRAARQVRPAMFLQRLVDRPVLHRPAIAAARWAPWTLGLAARLTRLPAHTPSSAE